METIILNTPSAESKIYVGMPFSSFKSLIDEQKKIVIVTDSNINSIYGKFFSEFNVIEIPAGEASKSLKTIEQIYKKFLDINVDRYSFILGIGGGVVSDITGFAASTYLRGLQFGFVATTLLAQVDAAIGGKNGVNFLKYKNMIGTFNQPAFVICDQNMLETLDERLFRCGLAEIIKAVLIGNKDLFELLGNFTESDNNKSIDLRKDKNLLNKIITEAIKIKTAIVKENEKDKGVRQLLNLGHTFAHSIESKTGMYHGEAVAIGICLASEISVKMGFLRQSDFEWIKAIFIKYQLPVTTSLSYKELVDAIIKDKKKENDFINLILLKSIGEAFIHKMKLEELYRYL